MPTLEQARNLALRLHGALPPLTVLAMSFATLQGCLFAFTESVELSCLSRRRGNVFDLALSIECSIISARR